MQLKATLNEITVYETGGEDSDDFPYTHYIEYFGRKVFFYSLGEALHFIYANIVSSSARVLFSDREDLVIEMKGRIY